MHVYTPCGGPVGTVNEPRNTSGSFRLLPRLLDRLGRMALADGVSPAEFMRRILEAEWARREAADYERMRLKQGRVKTKRS